MYRSLSLLLCTALLLASTVGADEADTKVKKALEQMQGTWKVESMTIGGDKGDPELVQTLIVVIAGNRLKLKNANNAVVSDVTIKIDPSQKPPAIDLTGVKDTKSVLPGIYELEGDTLKLCWAEPGKARPPSLESKKGGGIVLLVVKRDKK